LIIISSSRRVQKNTVSDMIRLDNILLWLLINLLVVAVHDDGVVVHDDDDRNKIW